MVLRCIGRKKEWGYNPPQYVSKMNKQRVWTREDEDWLNSDKTFLDKLIDYLNGADWVELAKFLVFVGVILGIVLLFTLGKWLR